MLYTTKLKWARNTIANKGCELKEAEQFMVLHVRRMNLVERTGDERVYEAMSALTVREWCEAATMRLANGLPFEAAKCFVNAIDEMKFLDEIEFVLAGTTPPETWSGRLMSDEDPIRLFYEAKLLAFVESTEKEFPAGEFYPGY